MFSFFFVSIMIIITVHVCVFLFKQPFKQFVIDIRVDELNIVLTK